VKKAKFLAMIEQGSQHQDLVEQAHQEAEDSYFTNMETKEKIEDKMLNTHKVETKAVKCSQVRKFILNQVIWFKTIFSLVQLRGAVEEWILPETRSPGENRADPEAVFPVQGLQESHLGAGNRADQLVLQLRTKPLGKSWNDQGTNLKQKSIYNRDEKDWGKKAFDFFNFKNGYFDLRKFWAILSKFKIVFITFVWLFLLFVDLFQNLSTFSS